MPYTFTAQHQRTDTLTAFGEAEVHYNDCDRHMLDWELISQFDINLCTWCHALNRAGVWEAPRYLTVPEFHKAHDVATV